MSHVKLKTEYEFAAVRLGSVGSVIQNNFTPAAIFYAREACVGRAVRLNTGSKFRRGLRCNEGSTPRVARRFESGPWLQLNGCSAPANFFGSKPNGYLENTPSGNLLSEDSYKRQGRLGIPGLGGVNQAALVRHDTRTNPWGVADFPCKARPGIADDHGSGRDNLNPLWGPARFRGYADLRRNPNRKGKPNGCRNHQIPNTEPRLASTSLAIAKQAKAPKGLGSAGYEPLMKSLQVLDVHRADRDIASDTFGRALILARPRRSSPTDMACRVFAFNLRLQQRDSERVSPAGGSPFPLNRAAVNCSMLMALKRASDFNASVSARIRGSCYPRVKPPLINATACANFP